MSYLLLGERCLLAAVFFLAVLGKVRDPARFHNFTTSVQRLTRFPARTARVVASAIAVCEAVAAALLAYPLASAPVYKAGFALAVGLLAIFIAVVARAVRGGVLAECRCFGRSGSVMSKAMIVRNLLLMVFAVPGLALSPTGPATEPAYIALAVTGGLAVALFFARYYDAVVRAILTRVANPSGAKEPSYG